ETLSLLTREKALAMAEAAFALRKTDAAEMAAQACMALGLAFQGKHRREKDAQEDIRGGTS
ncbi:MAG: hypothetical protein LBE15_04645, partial [Burkholderiales bacterium]|nr:hypothetical protein [Burkholderiales bacterium]